MNYQTILLDRSDRVATITFNLPEKLNPIDMEVGRELSQALDEIERNDAVEIIVFRGAGRAFSAGGDLSGDHLRYHMLREDGPSHPQEMIRMTRFFSALFERIERLDRIVIGLVHGIVAGGGLELITAFDIIIAGEQARFADAHVNVGQLPGAGGSQRLSRLVGPLRAKEILLTGRFLKGREAYEIGLASYCVPNEDLEKKLSETIETLLEKSYAGRTAMKQFVNLGLQAPLPVAIEMERLYAAHHLTTHPDSLEGLKAFSEKRTPAYLPRGAAESAAVEPSPKG